jgi:nucleobase:cation symporter-1, NCS1 family
VWFAAVHNIGVYTAAAGFLLLGLPAWQVLIALLVGYLFAYVAAQLTDRAGQRYGIPLPVLARASTGV